MEDVVPALLEQIKREFAEAYETDQEITGIWERIDGEKAAAADIDAYATRTGDLLAEVLHRNISSDTLPDGRMYYNIANRVLSPVLEKNYDLVADVATLVQKQLNERAGIGIRPMRPEINRDRISGLVDLASDAERYDDVSGRVESGVLNYTQSVATDAVHDNAEFHYKAGLAPRIVRTAEAGCCQWCLDLAGTYDYKDVRKTGNDVYRRHANCRCTVEYDPGNGVKRQNVHTKQYSWKEDNEPLIEQRRQIQTELFPNPTELSVRAAWGLAATATSPDGLTIREELEQIPYEKAKEAIDFYGDAIRNQPIEHAIVIQKDGQVLHFRCDKTNVGIFDADLDGAYITHNHPRVPNGITSFGWIDVDYYSQHPEIAQIDCRNEEYNYSMRLLAPISKEEYDKAKFEAWDRKYSGIGKDEDMQDMIMSILQEWGKVEYEKQRIT